MSKLAYTVRSREIVDLVNALNSGALILQPYFQRNFVWRDIHRVEFIDTILRGLPFPQIFLARGAIDVDSLRSSSCVVDGQQRLGAIRDFVASKFEVDGKRFRDLSAEEKTSFLKYEVAVIDFDLPPDDPLLHEIFQRLNRTYYSLTAIEKLSSEYAPSELMILANALIGEYEDDPDLEGVEPGNAFLYDPNIPQGSLKWAKSNGDNAFSKLIKSGRVFSIQDVKRKSPLMITLNIICSALVGYYNRNNEVKALLDQYAEYFPERDALFARLVDLASSVFLKLPEDNVWLNKANFFSVCVEALKREQVDNEKLLEVLGRVGSNDFSDEYSLAAREAVNNKKQREIRAKFVAELIPIKSK